MPRLTTGDLAPWYLTTANLDVPIGGYRVVLFFLGSASNPQIQQTLAQFAAARAELQQAGVTFLGVSLDPNDRALSEKFSVDETFRFLWDQGGDLSVRYGVCQLGANGGIQYDPTTFVLDENLRVQQVIPLETHIPHVDRVISAVRTLPTVKPAQLITTQAPILLIPQVFSPAFCQELIELYEADGGKDSGFLQQVDQKTVEILDPTIKRRRDFLISEPALRDRVHRLIWQRVRPEIQKAFQFQITQAERYLVACYDETTQGFFRPHRDNLAAGTVHRRFAMTLNLNDGYEGGCLRFPEYGLDLYRPTPGSAAIFSCSLLHEATPVTQGKRFTLLSFFYTDRDAQLREQSQKEIVRPTAGHRAGQTSAQAPDQTRRH